MLEAEVVDLIRDTLLVEGDAYCPELDHTACVDSSENAGFIIAMTDGEKFLVTVTRIEEGQ